jgi:DNA modification methylase
MTSHDACLAVVRRCHAFILLIGARFGGEYQNQGKSITWREWEEACLSGLTPIILVNRKTNQLCRFIARARARRQTVRPTDNVAHPTEKAISVIKPLVATFSPPGGLVLDPFSGSGSTAVAAALAGRLCVGIELEEKYCQLARRRLGGVERFMRRRSQRLTSRPSTRALFPNT